MSEKQIDLDAMRALADNPHSWHCDDDNAGDCGMCERNDALHAAVDEIEQLRKERGALREALREVSETRIFVSSKDAANRAIDIADAALAAQGEKPHE